MTTKNINLTAIDCKVQLQRYNGPLPPSKLYEMDMFKDTDVSNLTTGVKRSLRGNRKRTIQDKPVVENDDEVSNVKKKKCSIQKFQSSKTEPQNPIISQKETKKTNCEMSTSVKSTMNNSTINDFCKISDAEHSLTVHIDNNTNNSSSNPLKTSKNKKSSSNKRKAEVIHTSKSNTFDEPEISNDTTTLKNSSIINGTVGYDIKKEEVVLLEKDKNLLKHLKLTSNKNLNEEINVNKDYISNELKRSNNTTLLKNSKKKKSSKYISNIKNVISNEPEEINCTTLPKKSENKITQSTNLLNMKNKIDTSYENNDIVNSQKYDYSLKKKVHFQNSDTDDNDDEDEEKSWNPKIEVDDISYNKDFQLTKGPGTNTIILNNNKSPIVKQKSSDEYCRDESTNSEKSYELTDVPKVNVNNETKLVKKQINRRKPKKINRIKIKMFQNLNKHKLSLTKNSNLSGNRDQLKNIPVVKCKNSKNSNTSNTTNQPINAIMSQHTNTNNLQLLDSSNINDPSAKCVPVTLSPNISIENNIPLKENVVISNEVITDHNINNTNNININTYMPCVATTSLPEFTSISLVSTENLSENVVFYQSSQLNTPEANSSYSFPILLSNTPEIPYTYNYNYNYNMSLLTEAASLQSEFNNKEIKNISPIVVKGRKITEQETDSNAQSIITNNNAQLKITNNNAQSKITNNNAQSKITNNNAQLKITNNNAQSKITNSNSQSKLTSTVTVSSQKVNKSTSRKYNSKLCEESVETTLQAKLEHDIRVLTKRFNIPFDSLRKTVVDEPLTVFQKKYSEIITPTMVTVTPIVKNVETKFNYSKYVNENNLDVQYKIEPIRESAAYEKTNLKDLMAELSKTMPSWSLSIISNPSRYVITNMSINHYGVPFANKCIVLDRYFRASVYINQCLEYTYCKRYTTATEIVNLIKTLDSL